MPPANQNQIPPQMYETASARRHHFNVLLIPFIIVTLLLLGAGGFAAWAYTSRQDYKQNTDKKINAAVEIAKQQEASEKEKEFLEREKQPLKEYKGPATFGSITIMYPKTWSAFVTENDRGTTPIDGYFHPSFVPGVESGTAFALRLEVVNQTYDKEMKQFEAKTKTGKVTVAPYKLDKVPSVLGARVDGEINTGQKDTMVLFPLRNQTIKISTESDQFLKDFTDIILANLVFTP